MDAPPIITGQQMWALKGLVEALTNTAIRSKAAALRTAVRLNATHIVQEDRDDGGLQYVPIFHDPNYQASQHRGCVAPGVGLPPFACGGLFRETGNTLPPKPVS